MQNNCSLQTVPNVSIKKNPPPRLALIIALAGSPGEEAKAWLLFPLSVLAVVLLRVCVSGLWLNGVRSVFCRAASPVSFMSTDFYHCENKILHPLLTPPLGLLQPDFLYWCIFFIKTRNPANQQNKTKAVAGMNLLCRIRWGQKESVLLKPYVLSN